MAMTLSILLCCRHAFSLMEDDAASDAASICLAKLIGRFLRQHDDKRHVRGAAFSLASFAAATVITAMRPAS